MERSSEEVIPSEAAVLITHRTDPIRYNQNLDPRLISTSSLSRPEWPTIDGPLGLSEQDAVGYARKFFGFGFVLLPLLWAVNCYYFWPVLRHARSFPQIRPYVVGSAIGFMVFSAMLASWALTFTIGGERLFGHTWDELVMYNVADRYGLTGWI
ncbi:probable gamma-secretase subunit PEN-2 [Cynara cardunculus var. scolymus]|uniref:probable gamma-secretase subunit PEN-2 n=1 Tax=Cynara cardunculus var. scolymus TaxID=59895 RepID=UPI000D62BFC2|nr:probable gamma-secretase subunit PEN-2 [Cynara cardunculus var. scolymus]